MPMMLGDLKSKYILLEGEKYRPCVEWCGDPVIKLELEDTLNKAQETLSKYPLDDWDGWGSYLSLIKERIGYVP